MGLDATVYCDCYAKGQIRRPPPQPELVYIDENGQVSLKWDQPGADQSAFYDWLENACEHGPMGELVSHHIGNIARVAYLRGALSESVGRFPVLLSKVVYNGTHSGDALGIDDVQRVRSEMEQLRDVHGPNRADEQVIREFERQMLELIDASQRVQKPIVF